MAHFAQINTNNIVTQVIVAEQDFIDSGAVGPAESWIQTSYNTQAGQHPSGTPLRKNYAGIGYFYDAVRDAFIPPRVFESWQLNESTCQWEPPVTYPDDGKKYVWNEEIADWSQINETNHTDNQE